MIVGTQIVYKLQGHIMFFFAGYKDSRMEVFQKLYKCLYKALTKRFNLQVY